MSSQWYCKIAGHERGPLSSQALKSMAAKGRLQPDDPIRQGADGSWVPASRVKGLFPSDEAAPVQEAKPEPDTAKPESDTESRPVLKAKPLEEELPQATESKTPAKTPAKTPPKAKPAAPRVAKPLAEPPAAPDEKAAEASPPVGTPVQAGAVQATPAQAGAAASDQFAFMGAESSSATRGSGRAGSATPTRKKKRSNMMLVGGLLAAIVVLCSIGAAVMLSGKDTETAKTSGDKTAEGKSLEEEEIIIADESTGEKSEKADPESPAAEASSAATDATQTDGKWTDASKASIKRGDVRVKVVSVQVGRPRMLKSTGRGTRPKAEALVVKLELQNTNPTKKLVYKSWGDRNIGVSLTDNFDNEYTQKTKKAYGGALVEGQDSSGSIYPGKSLVDAVIFEPPIDKAKFLRLELPALAFGASGRLNFEIPVSMINEMSEASSEADGRPPWEAAASAAADSSSRAIKKANSGEEPLAPGRGVPAITQAIKEMGEGDKKEADPFAEGAENDEDPDGDVSKIMRDIDEMGGGEKKSDKGDEDEEEEPARPKKSTKRGKAK